MNHRNTIEFDDDSKMPISEFSLDEMSANPSIVIIAKRGSGKSFVAKAILQKYKNIPVGIIISPTEADNPFYSNFFPDAYIYHEYNSSIIKKLLFRQKLILKKAKEKKESGKYIDPRAIVVMDDCLASKGTWNKDPPIQDLLFNGRHRQIMYILIMQFPLAIKPELRVNFDYVFLLADSQRNNLRKIHEHYAGMFPTFESFQQIFSDLTEDYGCMVIKNRDTGNSLFDKIAFYKAPDLRNIHQKFGCDQFKKFDEMNFNRDWEEKKFAIDYNDMLLNKKRSKERVGVKKIFKNDDDQSKKIKTD